MSGTISDSDLCSSQVFWPLPFQNPAYATDSIVPEENSDYTTPYIENLPEENSDYTTPYIENLPLIKLTAFLQPRMAVRYVGRVRINFCKEVRYAGTVRLFCNGTGTVRFKN